MIRRILALFRRRSSWTARQIRLLQVSNGVHS